MAAAGTKGAPARRGLQRPRAFGLGVCGVVGLMVVASTVFPSLQFPNDHLVYLARALLRGELHVDDLPRYPDVVFWGGHKYVPFGPFPSLVLMPFLPLLALGVHIVWVNHVVTLFNVAVLRDLLARIGVLGERRSWALLLFFGSTPYLGVAIVTNSNYFAHLVTVGLLFLAMWTAMRGLHPFLTGLCIGAVFLTRVPAAFSLPFFMWAVWSVGSPELRARVLRMAFLLSGPALGVLVSLVYNQLRFGNPLETGYALAGLAEPYLEQARSYGLFSPLHIPKNLFMMLLQGPLPFPHEDAPILQFPYVVTSKWGMGLLFTSPALLYAFRAKWSEPFTRAGWLAVVSVMVPVVTYYGVGTVQFGYRYGLDFLPFLLVLAARGLPDPMSRRAKWLVLLGVAVNLWGSLILLVNAHF